MTKRLISFILTLVLLIAIPLEARYRYNPYTAKLDFYEAAGDITLSDIGDITLTVLTTGNILYYNGTAWVNLATGANTNVLTLAGGIPSWAAAGAPAAHAATHLAAGADSVDHDLLLNYLAAQHLTLPSTIAAVLTDHNLLAHTVLGLFDASIDVDHNATTNYAANQHVVLPGTIAAVLTDHNLAAHTALGLFDASADVDHDATTNWVANKHIDWTAATANFSTSGTFTNGMDLAAEVMNITQTAVAGPGATPLINIDDDRTGVTANEVGEATIVIDAAGSYAFYIADGSVDFSATTQFYMRGDTHQFEDIFWTWADAADHAVIFQSAITGTEDQPLINISDARTGETANELSESTIIIDAEGFYALYILDGSTWFADTVTFAAAATFNSNMELAATKVFYIGGQSAWLFQWAANGAADDLLWLSSTNVSAATETTALFISDLTPAGSTTHDDYLSPTLVITNSEGADANDYAGVVIGERTQADITVAHYFDFYAMAGAVDAAVDPTAAELAAIFRFGASGSATPDYSTAPGDVLLEGSLEVDDNQQNAGYNRYDYIYWIESFDHGIAANRYSQMWDITSLNTQGNGTNTIDTTPSHITLTTDNNAVGDNEGTITYKQIIERSRLNRSEFLVDLGQTANTQFYCGWNTSQTNAMVAAADEYVIVFFDVADNANWQIKVGDGATEDVFTSAVAGDTNDIRHEIWVESDGTVHWIVNGTELDITGSVDNLMTANGHYLIVCQAQSVTGAAAIVAEMCYVENEKTKAN